MSLGKALFWLIVLAAFLQVTGLVSFVDFFSMIGQGFGGLITGARDALQRH